MLELLDELDRWIIEIPPLETPQRFGNLAFRQWGKRLEEVTKISPGFFCAQPFDSVATIFSAPCLVQTLKRQHRS